MFLKRIVNRNKRGDHRVYYAIARSVRINGKPQHQILHYLGHLSNAEVEAFANILARHKNPNLVTFDVSKLMARRHYSFLELWALHWIYRFFGLHQLFDSIPYAELLVLNRCCEPKSKYSVFPWASKTACPAFLGVPTSRTVDFDIYRNLDKMASMEQEVMKYLFSSLKRLGATGDSTLIYDITATYLEGSACVIAEYCYSPGGKAGHKQIKIALALTRDGFPFYWKVLKGNIGDTRTIPGLVNDLRTLFNIKNFTLIFDRGMFSDKNFRIIEMATCNYITALPADSLRKLDFPELMELSKVTEEMNHELRLELIQLEEDPMAPVKIPEPLKGFSIHREERVLYRSFVRGKKRYIVVFNPELWATRRAERTEKIKEAMARAKEINIDFAGAKKSRSLEVSRDKVRAILKDLQVDNIFSSRLDELLIKTVSQSGDLKEIRSFRAVLEPDQERLQTLERYDGLYCIVTDLSTDKITDEEVISAYRRKERIEDAFRSIKSDVKLRPIYVHTEKRIKGHVMVCVLAYLLEAFIEYRMKRHNSKFKRAKAVLDALSECTIDEYNLPGQGKPIRNLTMLTSEQLQLLKDLGLEDILSMKLIRPILDSDKYIPYDSLIDPQSLLPIDDKPKA
ncbi:MAG: IS1634 family transposase [Firmicutes bacterium]|nr:IS1634 family transposase [Bacillota bacterium]